MGVPIIVWHTLTDPGKALVSLRASEGRKWRMLEFDNVKSIAKPCTNKSHDHVFGLSPDH